MATSPERVRVVDVEAAGRLVLRRERQAEQPSLAPGTDAARDVEERLGLHHSRLHDAHLATLLEYEQPAGTVGSVRDLERVGQAGGDLLQAELEVREIHGRQRTRRQRHT
jgi:hypothetical protein